MTPEVSPGCTSMYMCAFKPFPACACVYMQIHNQSIKTNCSMLDMWLIVLLFSPGHWATRSHWHLEDAGSPWIFSSASWRWKFLSLQQPLTLSERSCPHQQGQITKSAQTVHSCSKARWRGGHLSPACLGQLSFRTEEPEKVWGRLYPLEPGRLLGSIEDALFRLTLGVSLSGTVRDSPLGDPGWPCAWLKVFGEKCNKSQKATLL